MSTVSDRVARTVQGLRTDRLATTSVALMVNTVLNSALGYVFWTLAARSYSATDVGMANVVISIITLVALFSDLGMRAIVIQELPRSRDRVVWSGVVSTCGLVVLGSTTIVSIATGVGLRQRSESLERFLVGGWGIAFVAFAVVLGLTKVLDGISTAERAGALLLRRNLLIALAKVAAVAALILGVRMSWRAIVLAALAGTALGLVWGVGAQLRRMHPGWRFTVRETRRTLGAMRGSMFGHYLLNLGGQLPGFVMPIEVAAQLSAKDTAYMSLTWMVGGAFMIVSPAVSSALFVQGRWEPDALHETTVRAGKLIAGLLAPLGIGMIIFGHLVLSIFGHAYAAHGYALLVVLVLSAIPDAYTNVYIGKWRALGYLNRSVALNVGMGLVGIALTWVLLPPLGVIGAGYAWLIAQSAGAVAVLVAGRGNG